jgi:hypothetical protein
MGAAFLHVETRTMHMHVVGVLVLDPTGNPGGFVWVPRTHPPRSGHQSVFVGETEDRVTATQIPWLGMTGGRRRVHGERGQLTQGLL